MSQSSNNRFSGTTNTVQIRPTMKAKLFPQSSTRKRDEEEILRSSSHRLALPLLFCTAALSGSAQELTLEPIEKVGRFGAVRTERAPVIDGDLRDEVWAAAPVISGFTQQDPDFGNAATVETHVRVLYDDDAIYFGAELVDSAPPTSGLGRRDSDVESDWFRVYLDPHLDRRSGASFWVNPANVQIDMILYNDTSSDRNWDGVWSSATRIADDRWYVEMRVPFSQLRFPAREQHVWGVNFFRRIARNNEQDRLVNTPKNESGIVSRFAYLTGIDGIAPKKMLEILPYVVVRGDRSGTVANEDPINEATDIEPTLGVDLKYGLTSNLTLTGTINPDFGQVEQDPAVLNLSEFELFFPEKRPFFVEGSSLFDYGRGGSNNNSSFNLFPPSFFYSRRIGREPQGSSRLDYDYADLPRESTILGAGKITGKTASGWSIGILDALTQRESAAYTLDGSRETTTVEPTTNYFIGRIAKDLGTNGRIGTLFTAVNREIDDSVSFLRKSAYSSGVDGHYFFGENQDAILEWFAGGSLVEGTPEAILETQRASARYYQRPDASHVEVDPTLASLSGWAGRVMLNKQTGKWRYNLQAQSYSPGFETNDAGFMQRSDVTATHAMFTYTNEVPSKRLREHNMWISKYQNWNHDGDLIANGVRADSFFLYPNYWYTFHWGGLGLTAYDDRKARGGPLIERPNSYDFGSGFGTDSRGKFWFEIWQGNFRAEDGGESHDIGSIIQWRPRENLTIRFDPRFDVGTIASQYVTVTADSAASSTYGRRYVFGTLDQHTFELGIRTDWTFTSRLTLQLYVQPFVATGEYTAFRELAQPSSRDYLVYGDHKGSIAYDPETGKYRVDPENDGSGKTFAFSNPDFNFRSLRGSAIIRWEFRPGSSVFLVWNENRSDEIQDGRFRLGHDVKSIAEIESDDTLIIKFSYWFGT